MANKESSRECARRRAGAESANVIINSFGERNHAQEQEHNTVCGFERCLTVSQSINHLQAAGVLKISLIRSEALTLLHTEQHTLHYSVKPECYTNSRQKK